MYPQYGCRDRLDADSPNTGQAVASLLNLGDMPPLLFVETWEVLKTSMQSFLDRSPLFNGSIRGTGPRYCPSIEDKIDRFSEKNSHQIFVEPEGWNTVEVYVNGFSTSLPVEIQYEALHKVKGFEQAKFFRPG